MDKILSNSNKTISNKKRSNDDINDDSISSNKKNKDGDLLHDTMNLFNESNVPLKENQKIEKCEKMLFSKVCEKLQLMENARKSKKITKDKLLNIIFDDELNESVTTYIPGQNPIKQSIFPLIRLLIPSEEKRNYNIKEATLAKMYSDFLGFKNHKDDSEDKKLLLNWKNAQRNDTDLGSMLENLLSKRVSKKDNTSTLFDISVLLDNIAETDGRENKSKIIETLVFNKFSAMQQKWIVRIILRDLKLGLTQKEVINRLHPRAYNTFAYNLDLRFICEMDFPEEENIHLGQNFLPMLAARMHAIDQVDVIDKSLAGYPFVMDLKLDGVRIITHLGIDDKRDEIFMHTRGGDNQKHDYKSTLGKAIRNSITKIDRCILDGEVCGWNNIGKSHDRFDNNIHTHKLNETAILKYGDDFRNHSNTWLQYNIFDVVYLDGENAKFLIAQAIEAVKDLARNLNFNPKLPTKIKTGCLTYLPLIIRRQLLSLIVEEKENVVNIIKSKVVTSLDSKTRKEELSQYFDQIVLEGTEGLIVKNLDSEYLLNDRDPSRWIKMKPDYGNETQDIDLLLLGAYRGKKGGFRGKGWTSFILGCKDDMRSTETETKYLTLSKVGTGLTFRELEELRDKLKNEVGEEKFDKKNPPPHLKEWIDNCNPKDDTIPEVYFNPEKSIVFQIKCAELCESQSFSAMMTTRFPRIECIRYDKSYKEIWTKTDVDNAYRSFLISKDVKKKDMSKINRRKLQNKRAPTSKIDSIFTFDASRINVIGNIFNAKKYCVKIPSGGCEYEGNNYSKEHIQTIIAEHKGIVEMNPTSKDTIIIAGTQLDASGDALKKSGQYDIISFRYILDCIDAQEFFEPERSDYIHVGERTAKLFANLFDYFGNSLNEDTNEVKLRNIYDQMDDKLSIKSSNNAAINSILKEHRNLSSMDWRGIVDAFDDEERMLIEYARMPFWSNNVLIYIDIYEKPMIRTSLDQGGNRASNDTRKLIDLADDKLVKYYSPLITLAVELEYYGANLSNCLDSKVSHIIIDPNDEVRVESIKDKIISLKLHLKIPYALKSTWARRCIEENCLIEPNENEKYFFRF